MGNVINMPNTPPISEIMTDSAKMSRATNRGEKPSARQHLHSVAD
jgi:hypothetical protein